MCVTRNKSHLHKPIHTYTHRPAHQGSPLHILAAGIPTIASLFSALHVNRASFSALLSPFPSGLQLHPFRVSLHRPPIPAQGYTPRRLHGRPRNINALLRLVADDLLSKAKSFPRHTYPRSFRDRTRTQVFQQPKNLLIALLHFAGLSLAVSFAAYL